MRKTVPFAALAVLAAAVACSESSQSPTGLYEFPAAAITVDPSPTGATVDTDKEDYFPGDVVTIVGTGWAPGETVHLHLSEVPVADGPHDWDVVADANGDFVDTSFSPGTQHLGVTFTLTATGETSGTATATFTDGNPQSLSLVNAQNPNPLTAGGSATYTVRVEFGGNANSCTLNLSAATTASPAWPAPPAGGFFSFAPAAVTGNGGSSPVHPQSTVTVSTPAGMAANTYNFVVTAARTSGCQGMGSETIALTLIVASADNTPPVIVPTITGTLGNNDWYTSDVTVTWSVTDLESAISMTTGCGSTTINTDTNGQTVTCSATSAGGTNSQSVTIKRDATAPTASASAAPPPNANGWNNSDVTVSFSGTDAMSGIADCSADVTLDSDGAGQSASGTCTDNAGNESAPASVNGINIDKTAPSVTGDRSPDANAHGWNNSAVTVTFSGTDALSGIDTCSGPEVLSSEGANQSAMGTCTDLAGNQGSATVSGINIDLTAPTATATPSPLANGFGWNNTDVTVTFTGTDALSGIAMCSDPEVLDTEGAGQSASGSCTDMAGNSTPASATGINIDKTSPTVSFVGGPANGGSYYFGSVPGAPTCSASDALSGLNGSCGVSGYGTTVGMHTVTATAADKAGNMTSESVTYTVLAWITSGFYQPVNMDPTVFNTVKAGSTVPLKFELFAAAEITTTSAISSFKQQVITCPSGAYMTEDPVDVTTTGGTVLRYDTTDGQFIQNWQTPKNKAGTCYKVTMTAQDGSTITANFKLK